MMSLIYFSGRKKFVMAYLILINISMWEASRIQFQQFNGRSLYCGCCTFFFVGPKEDKQSYLLLQQKGLLFASSMVLNVDVDPVTENVFFTSASTTYDIRYNSHLCKYVYFLILLKNLISSKVFFIKSGVSTSTFILL